ncbi:MAG: hypothetical protein HFJ37_00895 [Clostridia bacterium]|nr:hypothetical protein [Clostridia bacterium]
MGENNHTYRLEKKKEGDTVKAMKNIYIVLTHTGTTLSKIIKNYTKDEFSHISIALDEKLEEMYSFGRRKPYNPLIGGFVHERIHCGTFKRFENTTEAEVYFLKIEEEQYKKIKKTIEEMVKQKEKYTFNMIGLVAVAFHKRICFKNSFYCAEFVKYVLEKAKVTTNLPETIKPEDFKNLANINLIYKGKLKHFKVPELLEV